MSLRPQVVSSLPLHLDPGPRGGRYTLDSFLLADFASASLRSIRSVNPAAPLVADLCAGTGVVGILMAVRRPALRVAGIDLQDRPLRLAVANARRSGLARRVGFIRADVRRADAWARPGSFHAAVINPPYHKAGTGRLSPDPARAMARHELTLPLASWIGAARHLLAPGGRLFFSHPAERETEVFGGLKDAGFALQRFRRVHPSRGGPAAILLAEASAPGPEAAPSPLALRPLVVCAASGLYTEEIRRLYARFGIETRRSRASSGPLAARRDMAGN